MDAVLHAISALPGHGRYAVTFRRPDGTDQTAVVHVAGDVVEVAEASLPGGWTRGGALFRATAEAVLAFDAARGAAPADATLHDVEGGWDVSLGNVVLGRSGVPACTAHGDMDRVGAEFACSECGARALLR